MLTLLIYLPDDKASAQELASQMMLDIEHLLEDSPATIHLYGVGKRCPLPARRALIVLVDLPKDTSYAVWDALREFCHGLVLEGVTRAVTTERHGMRQDYGSWL